MASDNTLRSTRLPTPEQVSELLREAFDGAGFELDDVVVDAAARPPRIVLVVDGDTAPDLDDVADLSRSASDLLDALGDTEPYVLEVTSPGVDRPLTARRHYERARGRKVQVTLADGAAFAARIGEFADGGDVVRLIVPAKRRGAFDIREIALADVAKAVVQVEFSTPSKRELELAGMDVSEVGESVREIDQ